jgi:uncharacterized protein (TIGR03437 family)
VIPAYPVSVSLGGKKASVTYVGALGMMNGVLEVKFVVPDAIDPGGLALVVTAGGADSQGSVTVNVR